MRSTIGKRTLAGIALLGLFSSASLAQAVGLKGLRVEDPAKVRPALEEALGAAGPVLVDVETDPNVLSMPPRATILQAAGFALATTKMAFNGQLEDVWDTVAANW